MSISTKSQGPVENHLLAALPDEVFARLLPHLKPVSFALGGVVYESSERMETLFPDDLHRLFALHHDRRRDRRDGPGG